MNERLEEMNNKLVLIIGWGLENVAHVSSHFVHFSSIVQYLQKGLQFLYVGPSHSS